MNISVKCQFVKHFQTALDFKHLFLLKTSMVKNILIRYGWRDICCYTDTVIINMSLCRMQKRTAHKVSLFRSTVQLFVLAVSNCQSNLIIHAIAMSNMEMIRVANDHKRHVSVTTSYPEFLFECPWSAFIFFHWWTFLTLYLHKYTPPIELLAFEWPLKYTLFFLLEEQSRTCQ